MIWHDYFSVYTDIHGKKLGVSNKTINANFEEFMDFMLEGLHDDLNRRGRSLTSKGTNWPTQGQGELKDGEFSGADALPN